MEILTLALLILIVVLLITTKDSLLRKITALEDQVNKLERFIEFRLTRPADSPSQQKETVNAQPISPPPVSEPKPQPVWPPVVERYSQVITPDGPRPKGKPEPPKPYVPEPNIAPPIADREPQLSFFERHPDLEKFIGENLINKIGIAILVLGIGFFVKLAIDNNWIGPAGRVGVGILCGAILVGIAHYLRKSFKAFSSVLAGGGLAVFYFTITLAFHQFNLFNQITAFIILSGITVFAVLLSLLYDRQELAVIALIGGFASPFMVSTGSSNYGTLFIYLLILNTGLLIIAYNKSWRVLNILSFIFTVILFATVLFALSGNSYGTAFVYASLFYLLYFVINVAYNIRENKSFIASDFGILLINTALYFAAGLYLLNQMHFTSFRGLFSAGLAAINLVLSYLLFKNKKVDINILYLLIGITLTFISLTAPIQLHGHYITLFWAAECVLLYWLYQKSAIALMKTTSFLIWVAMLTSLLMDLFANYSDSVTTLSIAANKGFITTVCAAISSYSLYQLIKRGTHEQKFAGKQIDQAIFQISGIILLFLAGFLEVNHQFLNHFPGTLLNLLYLSLYTSSFVLLLNNIAAKTSPENWQLTFRLTVCTLIAYHVILPFFFDLQEQMLKTRQPPPAHFAAHWVNAAITGILFIQLIQSARKNLKAYTAAAWLISFGIVIFLSFEFCLLSNMLFYTDASSIGPIETIYIKTFLPVLWGVLSFILMWLGMRYKTKSLRIISLTLFSITLVKLFVYDISNIPAAGKIIAFFCLGILLLIISFMYQKVKKIIVDEEKKDI
jgi:uncharacterized membrane protein